MTTKQSRLLPSGDAVALPVGDSAALPAGETALLAAGESPVLPTGEALDAVLAALAAVDHGARKAASHQDRLRWVDKARDARRRIEALAASLIAEADRADSSKKVTGTPMTSWLSRDKRTSSKEALADIFSGQDLNSREAVKKAALGGEIGVSQAREITKLLDDLPRSLDPEQKKRAEEITLEKARNTPASAIRHLRKKVLEAVRPDTSDSREEEMQRLEQRRQRAIRRRSLSFYDDGDGSYKIFGSLPHLEAQPLMKLVDAYMESERRLRREDRTDDYTTVGARRADALVAIVAAHTGAAAGPGTGNSAASAGSGNPGHDAGSGSPRNDASSSGHLGDAGVGSPRNAAGSSGHLGEAGSGSRRNAAGSGKRLDDAGSGNTNDPQTHPETPWTLFSDDASGSLAGQAAGTTCTGCGSAGQSVGLPPVRVPNVAGDRPRVTVTIREADLYERIEQAGLFPDGTELTPGELRRILCDAEIMPAVLGSASEVLDLGRSERLVTPALRRALSLRDGGCIFPGCEVPDVSCEAHHIIPWWNHGPTSLWNLVLLCPHHHAEVEPARFFSGAPPDKWVIRMGPDGIPEVIPSRRFHNREARQHAH